MLFHSLIISALAATALAGGKKPCDKNLVKNGDFAKGLRYWTTDNSVKVVKGQAVLQSLNNTMPALLSQTVETPAFPNGTYPSYTISFAAGIAVEGPPGGTNYTVVEVAAQYCGVFEPLPVPITNVKKTKGKVALKQITYVTAGANAGQLSEYILAFRFFADNGAKLYIDNVSFERNPGYLQSQPGGPVDDSPSLACPTELNQSF